MREALLIASSMSLMNVTKRDLEIRSRNIEDMDLEQDGAAKKLTSCTDCSKVYIF